MNQPTDSEIALMLETHQSAPDSIIPAVLVETALADQYVSLDGPLGSGASVGVSDLGLGTHTITASATDAAANTATGERGRSGATTHGNAKNSPDFPRACK